MDAKPAARVSSFKNRAGETSWVSVFANVFGWLVIFMGNESRIKSERKV